MNTFLYSDSQIFLSHSYDETPAPQNFYMHTHTHAELYCFLGGSAVFHVEGTAYPLEPGDILLMRPGEAHYVQVDTHTPYARICLNFDTGILRSLDPAGELTRSFYDHKAGKRNHYRPEDGACVQLLRSMLSQSRPVILGNLILLLQKLAEQFSSGERPADTDTLEYRMIRYINKNLDKPLTLEQLCDRFFVSRTQLCRMFKQATGTSVGGYISAKRLLHARELLLQGDKPTEVYAPCGYRDYSTFFRAYTKFFGHNPRDAQNFRDVLTPDAHILLG